MIDWSFVWLIDWSIYQFIYLFTYLFINWVQVLVLGMMGFEGMYDNLRLVFARIGLWNERASRDQYISQRGQLFNGTLIFF